MSDDSFTSSVKVVNPQGIHARPSALLVRRATEFQSDIRVRNLDNGAEANAKFLLEVMTLVATMGTELSIEAEGADAKEAAGALVELISSGFGES